MKLKYILWLIIAALVIVIFIQNTQVVTYRIFFWKISISQVILVPLILLFGFVLGVLVAKSWRKR